MCYGENKINLNISYGTLLIYVILRKQTRSFTELLYISWMVQFNDAYKMEWESKIRSKIVSIHSCGRIFAVFLLATIIIVKWSSSSSWSQWMSWWHCKSFNCWTNATSPRMTSFLAIFKCWNWVFKLSVCCLFSLEFGKQYGIDIFYYGRF